MVAEDERVELRDVRLTDPEVAPLLAGLAGEFERRYGPIDLLSDASPKQFEPPDGAFVVLVDGGRTVAGGGIRRWATDTCELKRMWTDYAHRRRGHAAAVLTALEERATAQGYLRIRLETGPAQPEAIGLYTARGYRGIPVYGAHESALAFERDLRT